MTKTKPIKPTKPTLAKPDFTDFVDRYATCPLCHREDVRILRFHFLISGRAIPPTFEERVVLEAHPIGLPVVAHSAPINKRTGTRPRRNNAKQARVQCPASNTALMERVGNDP